MVVGDQQEKGGDGFLDFFLTPLHHVTKTDQLQVSEKADPEPEWDRTGVGVGGGGVPGVNGMNRVKPGKGLLPPSGSSRTKQNLTQHPAHGATMMSQMMMSFGTGGGGAGATGDTPVRRASLKQGFSWALTLTLQRAATSHRSGKSGIFTSQSRSTSFLR